MRRNAFAPLVFVVAFLVLAGCAGTNGSLPPGSQTPRFTLDPSWAEHALVFGSEHNHASLLDHANLTTPNFEVLGWEPMVSTSKGTSSYYFPCGDAKAVAGDRRLAIVESETDIGFGIADITDPKEPKYLGEIVLKTTQEYDVGLVPDGRHVVMVTDLPKQPDSGGEPFGGVGLTWRDACGERPILVDGPGDDLLPRPNSLLLISIVDPRNPSIVDQRPLSGVGHSVSSVVVDGRTWVSVAAWGNVNQLSTYQFYDITTTPAGPKLGYLSTFTLPPTTNTADALGGMGHNDVWLVKHPKTGQTLAYMAHWDHGLIIADLSNPMTPRQIAQWTDYNPARPRATGSMHSLWVAPDLWDGKHYVVTGPELGSRPIDQPTGTVNVIDTTDPMRPTPVGAWTLPHDVQWTKGGEWSGHYLTVVDRTAFITMYHGGVWAIDLSGLTAQFQSLPSIGVFLPSNQSPSPASGVSPWAPMLGEVHAFDDGTMVTFEATSGLYTFQFDNSMPMPSPMPWPIPKPPGAS